jgi:hypothetical protein
VRLWLFFAGRGGGRFGLLRDARTLAGGRGRYRIDGGNGLVRAQSDAIPRARLAQPDNRFIQGMQGDGRLFPRNLAGKSGRMLFFGQG